MGKTWSAFIFKSFLSLSGEKTNKTKFSGIVEYFKKKNNGDGMDAREEKESRIQKNVLVFF